MALRKGWGNVAPAAFNAAGPGVVTGVDDGVGVAEGVPAGVDVGVAVGQGEGLGDVEGFDRAV